MLESLVNLFLFLFLTLPDLEKCPKIYKLSRR